MFASYLFFVSTSVFCAGALWMCFSNLSQDAFAKLYVEVRNGQPIQKQRLIPGQIFQDFNLKTKLSNLLTLINFLLVSAFAFSWYIKTLFSKVQLLLPSFLDANYLCNSYLKLRYNKSVKWDMFCVTSQKKYLECFVVYFP